MTTLPKLNDLQLVLLASAAQRDNGSLLPPPTTIAQQAERIRKAIPPLLKHGLVEEIVVSGDAEAWRHEDAVAFDLVITDQGRAVIAGDGPEASDDAGAPAPCGGSLIDVPSDFRGITQGASKIAKVLALLRAPEGATLDDLVGATGWLPHTTRAALTGLRKKGHVIERVKCGEVSCYQIKGKA